KALVPGNHDIWVEADDPRGDSLTVYREHLPAACAAHGFHYLDAGPLLLPEADLAVVGTINWYDYSWAIDLMKQHVPDWEDRLPRAARPPPRRSRAGPGGRLPPPRGGGRRLRGPLGRAPPRGRRGRRGPPPPAVL